MCIHMTTMVVVVVALVVVVAVLRVGVAATPTTKHKRKHPQHKTSTTMSIKQESRRANAANPSILPTFTDADWPCLPSSHGVL